MRDMIKGKWKKGNKRDNKRESKEKWIKSKIENGKINKGNK